MITIICSIVSFIVGWRLSTWSKGEPFASGATELQADLELTAPIINQTPAQSSQVDTMEQGLTLSEVSQENALWFCDMSYLDDDDTTQDKAQEQDQSSSQAEQYFIDLFLDEDYQLQQRLEALRAAVSMDQGLLNASIVDELYQLALRTLGEPARIEDTLYMLSMLEGRVSTAQLSGLVPFLDADDGQIREEALKIISRGDRSFRYRGRIESILNNDPHSEVRALAHTLIEQYYSPKAA